MLRCNCTLEENGQKNFGAAISVDESEEKPKASNTWFLAFFLVLSSVQTQLLRELWIKRLSNNNCDLRLPSFFPRFAPVTLIFFRELIASLVVLVVIKYHSILGGQGPEFPSTALVVFLKGWNVFSWFYYPHIHLYLGTHQRDFNFSISCIVDHSYLNA